MTNESLLFAVICGAFGLIQIILLGLGTWTLLEVVKHGQSIAEIKTRMDGLPCDKCTKQT